MSERIRSLDGLRTAAILLVFIAHAFFIVIGWIGVDLFFALSGFLITGILRRDRTSGSFWSRFYTRRATRILPPLLLAISAALALFPITWWQILPYALFAGNIGELLHPGSAYSLGVLWSLAVEEHFYLLWPFAIRYLSKRSLVPLCCVLLVTEPLLRAILTPHFKTFWPIYLLTPFRLDGLLCGSLLALLLEDEPHTAVIKRWSGRVFAITCVVWGGLSFFASFDRAQNSILFNSLGYSLLALGSSSLVAFVLLHPAGWTSRILSLRTITFLGVVSYGFYLYHVVLLDAWRIWSARYQVHHTRLLAPFAFVITLALSAVSFYGMELPIVRWGKRISSPANRKQAVSPMMDAAQ